MSFIQIPTPFRRREFFTDMTSTAMMAPANVADGQSRLLLAATNATFTTMESAIGKSTHLDFVRLAVCVCEAVLEVVFVALPGFIVAYNGMFDINSQKFVAELNTMVFTPCLIFTKLASQLDGETLVDLAIIPVIFAIQTFVSWVSSLFMARLFGFGRKQRHKNFILAMGVFGNANSLPISLVLSLSQTIPGLLWDQIPNDNANEVAARGILYLLIFQQLGQLLRWTWGYSVLLKPKEAYDVDEPGAGVAGTLEEEESVVEAGRYRDFPENDDEADDPVKPNKPIDSAFGSGTQSLRSNTSEENLLVNMGIGDTPTNGNHADRLWRQRTLSTNHISRFPSFATTRTPSGLNAQLSPWRDYVDHKWQSTSKYCTEHARKFWGRLPRSVQKTLATFHHYSSRFWIAVWRQMNPPLWAMLAALVVASVPALQRLFFTPGTLINNSVTSAIKQSGGVAVPLILTVLGANVARSALPADSEDATSPEEASEERRLLIASILARMVLPIIIIAPLLCLAARYVPVSILDDPIFLVVCFLLSGSPSALQLAQICQINNVFMGVMSRLLVWSYVVAIFPSTLALVMMALKGLELADA